MIVDFIALLIVLALIVNGYRRQKGRITHSILSISFLALIIFSIIESQP